ncbi:protein of unknown function [Candidatus Nitrosocosmicus franklandus]|uniref:Uncharacterized protein n=1 Tax=Candidatus Nitrosocosmicus franklandianus TaxID=1798806 RepID=A0A484IGF6_9ARCH|nr:protein of unknown function [Candidatus Nitrosocosmicus franklandus]
MAMINTLANDNLVSLCIIQTPLNKEFIVLLFPNHDLIYHFTMDITYNK